MYSTGNGIPTTHVRHFIEEFVTISNPGGIGLSLPTDSVLHTCIYIDSPLREQHVPVWEYN